MVRRRSQLCCLDYLLASLPPVPRQENCPPADLMLFLRGGHYKEVSNDRFSTEDCLKSVNVTAQMDLVLNIFSSNIPIYFFFLEQFLKKKERLLDYASTCKWISLPSCLWRPQSRRLGKTLSRNSVAHIGSTLIVCKNWKAQN